MTSNALPRHDSPAAAEDRLADLASRTSYGIVDLAGALQDVGEIAKRQMDEVSALDNIAHRVNLATRSILDTAVQVTQTSDQIKVRADQAIAQISAESDMARMLASWVEKTADEVGAIRAELSTVREDNERIAAIASNVNILAINAGIEAARAGEAGRGFAVVADAINDLSKKTTAAAKTISENVDRLTKRIDGFQQDSLDMAPIASRLHEGAAKTDASLSEISNGIAETRSHTQNITLQSVEAEGANKALLPAFERLAKAAERNSQAMIKAEETANLLIDDSEGLVRIASEMGQVTEDTPFIKLVQETAQKIAEMFAAGIAKGRISHGQLFDQRYKPIPHSNPEQLIAPFTTFLEHCLPAFQEPILAADPRIVFCAAVDQNGYLPVHNKKFSQKPSKDPVWNMANCRNRRMFNDRVGLKAGRNRALFLLQVYRRDMGGGTFALMKDVSAPIIVGGQHWGGLRLAYRS